MTRLFSSLRARFLAAILIWVALGIGALWFSSVRLFSSHVEQQYHEELEVHVRELAELTVLDAAGNPRLSRPLSDPRYAVPLSGFYWQIGRPGYRSLKSPSMTRGALDEDVAHSPDILHRVENGPTGPTITYGFERAVPGGAPLHFVIATDERLLRAVIASFTRELSLWLSLLALALLASGLAIITLGFRPFNRLAARIAALPRGQADHIGPNGCNSAAPKAPRPTSSCPKARRCSARSTIICRASGRAGRMRGWSAACGSPRSCRR